MKMNLVPDQNLQYLYNEDIVKELVDYSYQKDAYQREKIESDLLFALIVEKARWLQFVEDDQRIMKKPEFENAFIGIAIHSTKNFHFVKNLTVMVTVYDEKGTFIGEHQHLYHPRPELHNYGRNWILPESGMYTIVVKIENQNNRVGQNLSVRFSNINIQTGQHIS
jgi:hypothetical protein